MLKSWALDREGKFALKTIPTGNDTAERKTDMGKGHTGGQAMPSIKSNKSGAQLRTARLDFDVSIREVARAACVSPSTVLRWERVKLLPKFPTNALRRIARTLRLRIFVQSGPRRHENAFDRLMLLANEARLSGPCAARTRNGTECRRSPVPGKRRCKLHGGRSTGPTTEEGRRRCSEAAREMWAARKQRKP
jgi:transcriptional regulator with XRE-family HTH domain